MPRYNQLVKSDYPAPVNDQEDFKPQVAKINATNALIWNKIEELKKLLGQDRAILNNTVSSSSLAPAVYSLFSFTAPLVYNAITGVVGISTPIAVQYGGTGLNSLTDHSLLVGSGTSPITPLGVATNGQIPIGSVGANPVLAVPLGTANQVTVTPGAGTLTFSLPQNIHTGATPTFAGITLTGFNGLLLGTAGVVSAITAVDGDVVIGNATPTWQRLGISIPAVNVRNVFGVDNGELRPSWKTALDGTAPEAITIGAAGSAGTSLIFSHRDHAHPSPATWTATAHNLLSAIHGDTTTGACVVGDLVVGGAGPAWTKLADVDVGQVLQSGGVGVLPAWTATAYLSESLVIGNTPIVAGSLLELYSSSANPIMTITGAHATSYDPQIQFRTDAVPTVKWYMGVDATDDNFYIDTASIGGSSAPIEINYTTGYIGFNSAPMTGSPNARYYFYDTRSNANWYNMWVDLRSTVTGATVTVSNWALAFGTQITASATNNQGAMVGIYGYSLVYSGAGRTRNVYGIQAQHGNYTGVAGGIIDNSVGIWIDTRHATAGFTISNSFDLYFNAPLSVGATVTNEWVIYSAHIAPSRFLGDLRIFGDGTSGASAAYRFVCGAANDSAFFYNGTQSVFQTLVGTATWIFDGYTTVESDVTAWLLAGEAKDAILQLTCDENDDAGDNWRIRTVYDATSANNLLKIQNDTSVKETYVDKLIFTTTGNVKLPSDSGYFICGAGDDFGIKYNGTNTIFETLVGSAIYVFDGYTTVESDCRVVLGAGEAKDAILDFTCDEGDDAFDTFRLRTVYNATSANNTLDWQALTVLPSTFVTAFRMYTTGQLSLILDSVKFTTGAGNDFGWSYDGTYGLIDSSLVAPSDIRITCGANKTIELQNVVYEDLRVTPGSFDRPGVSDPAYVAYDVGGGGTNTYLPEFKKNDFASFTVQIPHSYKEGTDLSVHIHWTPRDRGNEETGATVGWKVQYAWANIDGTFGAMATADLSDACDGTDHKHQMTPAVTISGAGKTISSMLVCNITRTDTGADDTWASTTTGQLPLLLEVDFHFQINTLGSRQLSTK